MRCCASCAARSPSTTVRSPRWPSPRLVDTYRRNLRQTVRRPTLRGWIANFWHRLPRSAKSAWYTGSGVPVSKPPNVADADSGTEHMPAQRRFSPDSSLDSILANGDITNRHHCRDSAAPGNEKLSSGSKRKTLRSTDVRIPLRRSTSRSAPSYPKARSKAPGSVSSWRLSMFWTSSHAFCCRNIR